MAADPRLEQYANLLVGTCVDVQPGWQVAVRAQPLARPLVDEVVRAIARRGAYAFVRLSYGALGLVEEVWVKEAPEELLREPPALVRQEIEQLDSFVVVLAPENTRAGSDIPQERLALIQQSVRPYFEPFMSGEQPWVGCQYPTDALAQDAGMTLEQFSDFLYGAVLIDWDALAREMRRIADRFDAGNEVRIVAEGTDVRFSLEGRNGKVSAADANMPSGEVFYSPVEDSAS